MAERTADVAKVPEEKKRKEEAAQLWRNKTVRREIRAPARAVLSEMAPGIDGCMYCGNHKATDVEHYEPKSRRPLRTFCWFNYLLVCSECNSGVKGAKFPLDRLGQPALIDPTREDPFRHLRLVLPICAYVGLTERGQKTIDALKLNERQLPESRKDALDRIGTLLFGWTHAVAAGDERWRTGIVQGVREHPYADVVQALLREAEADDAEAYFREYRYLLPLLRDSQLKTELALPSPR
ncbi:hypothetical protein ACWC9R_33930 [Streptomyces sp. NPDC001219]